MNETTNGDLRPGHAIALNLVGLRDVAADIRDVCSWLRRNWRPGMPLLEVDYAHSWERERGALVCLVGRCTTAQGLREAAEVMGVEVRPARVRGYVEATRVFGRVLLRAWLVADRWDDEVTY